MSGTFEALPMIARSRLVKPRCVGTLSVPDFDAPPPPPAPDTAELAATAAADAARVAELEAARATGHAAGHAAAAAEAARSREAAEVATLQAIAAALLDARQAALAAAEAAASAVARLLLAALDAALPAAAAQLAPETTAQLVTVLAPLLESNHGVVVRVAPGCGEAAIARIGDPRVDVLEDPALMPGDATATWRGGGAVTSLAHRRGAVAAILATFGLHTEGTQHGGE